jgi:hypothetical protein
MNLNDEIRRLGEPVSDEYDRRLARLTQDRQAANDFFEAAALYSMNNHTPQTAVGTDWDEIRPTIDDRHQEILSIMNELLDEMKEIKQEVFQLKKEIMDLKQWSKV